MKKIDDKYKDLIWSATQGTYEEAKQEFYDSWKTPRLIYIILLCLFIIPGVIWGWLIYNTKYAKEERMKMANAVIYKSINKIDRVDDKIETVNAHSVTQHQEDIVQLPMTKTQAILKKFAFMDPAVRSATWNGWLNPNSARTAPIVAQQLETFDLMQEISGRRDGVVGLAAKHLNSGKLMDRKAAVYTNAVATVKLTSGLVLQIANAKLRVKETYRVRDKNTNTYKNELKVLTLWSGLVVNTTLKGTYPYSFKVISKDFSTTRDKAYPKSLAPIEYELESVDFTDGFDLLVEKEDPVKLRKQFSINNLAHFVNLQLDSAPMVASSTPDGVAFAFDTITQQRNDMPLNIEKPWKFFRKEEYAKEVLNQEFTVLLNIIKSIAGLEKDKFFKPNTDIKVK